jgi:hypothetical protein
LASRPVSRLATMVSGDEETDGKTHVDFPESRPFDPHSRSVTMLSNPDQNVSEVTWWEAPGQGTSDGGGSSGGGVSKVFRRPAWQDVHIKSLSGDLFDGRVLPDIAALAGPPLYDLVFLGKDAPNGGTSASAPLWTALIARLNAAWPPVKRQRFLRLPCIRLAQTVRRRAIRLHRCFHRAKRIASAKGRTTQEKDMMPSLAGGYPMGRSSRRSCRQPLGARR